MNAVHYSLEICKVCIKKAIDKGVESDGNCKGWYRPECIKLSASEYKKIANGLVKSWNYGRVDCSLTIII